MKCGHSKLINLNDFVSSKIPENTYFKILLITSDQVLSFINKLDASIDGLGQRVTKMAANILSPSIATLINKHVLTGTFPSQMARKRFANS